MARPKIARTVRELRQLLDEADKLQRSATEAGSYVAAERLLRTKRDLQADLRAAEEAELAALEADRAMTPDAMLDQVIALVPSLPDAFVDRLSEAIEQRRRPRLVHFGR